MRFLKRRDLSGGENHIDSINPIRQYTVICECMCQFDTARHLDRADAPMGSCGKYIDLTKISIAASARIGCWCGMVEFLSREIDVDIQMHITINRM